MSRIQTPEMSAAIAEAKRTLPQFLTMLENPGFGVRDFEFKYPLGGSEHIWATDVERRGDVLVGKLGNVPTLKGHAMGDTVEVPLGEVSDWAYRDAKGLMHGHYTTRAMLPHLDPAESAEVRKVLGWHD